MLSALCIIENTSHDNHECLFSNWGNWGRWRLRFVYRHTSGRRWRWGLRSLSHFDSWVGLLRGWCYQNHVWHGARGVDSASVWTQLASRVVPRLRISFPQAWPRMGDGRVAKAMSVACSKKGAWNSWSISVALPCLFWAVWSPHEAVTRREGRLYLSS